MILLLTFASYNSREFLYNSREFMYTYAYAHVHSCDAGCRRRECSRTSDGLLGLLPTLHPTSERKRGRMLTRTRARERAGTQSHGCALQCALRCSAHEARVERAPRERQRASKRPRARPSARTRVGRAKRARREGASGHKPDRCVGVRETRSRALSHSRAMTRGEPMSERAP